MKKVYKVKEVFYSIQGEGWHTGTPAVFIRFFGCNLKCPFCDEAGGYHQDMTAEEIREAVFKCPEKSIVVLTGGEPCIQVDEDLLRCLNTRQVHIETNGTFSKVYDWREKSLVHWVCVSPKQDGLSGEPDEVKWLYGNGLRLFDFDTHCSNLFVQPCEDGNGSNIKATIEFVKNHPEYRLSLQTHKLIGVK